MESTFVAMFLVSDADAVAIRTALQEGGELAAAVELRRRFPGLDSNAQARRFARTIAGWSVPVGRPVGKDVVARGTSIAPEQGEVGSGL